MNRRSFIFRSASAFIAAAHGQEASSQAIQLKVNRSTDSPKMPEDFIGLSYESAQLTNPEYFSPENRELIAKFRALSASGVLRLGGHLSNLTEWSYSITTQADKALMDKAANAYEWLMVDSIARSNRTGIITPQSIENLGGFLNATGWGLLYGLNPLTGSHERAAQEAALVQRVMGDRLIAFQIGNEPDRFRSVNADKDITFEEYWRLYESYTKAVRMKTPGARFAGPDTTRRAVDWEAKYAERAKGDAVLVTSHYYDGTGTGDLTSDAARLLRRDDKLIATDIPVAMNSARAAGARYRMSEGNSFAHGGEDGVSNAFASALWGVDYLLLMAQSGASGVNLHGGGDCNYSPIAGDEKSGFTERPVYFGMQFAARFCGSRFLECRLDGKKWNVSAYSASRDGVGFLLGLVNKDGSDVSFHIHPGFGVLWRAMSLTGPSLGAKSGTRFQEVAVPKGPTLNVPAYSAMLFEFRTL
jgi:hypothetical protein